MDKGTNKNIASTFPIFTYKVMIYLNIWYRSQTQEMGKGCEMLFFTYHKTDREYGIGHYSLQVNVTLVSCSAFYVLGYINLILDKKHFLQLN